MAKNLPHIIKGRDPSKRTNPFKIQGSDFFEYFLNKTEARAFINVDVKIKPSPVSLKLCPIFCFEFTKIIPAVPIIRARIVFDEILSSGTKNREIITIIKEFDACMIDDFTPLVLERPI